MTIALWLWTLRHVIEAVGFCVWLFFVLVIVCAVVADRRRKNRLPKNRAGGSNEDLKLK